ncbi:hypothetical protein [Tengunoibacter tsumagoiensis]|uniref:General stress protein 17M-like domain-containing protein n=1 Tax=Tengunoibacter tsumagoiensis TaxID=2014871 RepID=A0A402A4R0_9CHLR|nr:hypothetical protein [Tengunoibacter tsumagoiensis]GCE14090.1 hypothetical protein KTT_39490 [Tengunoibacter tsumagoiensis]
MATTERTTAVGAFTEQALAERAIEELKRSGFTEDQIGFVARHSHAVDGREVPADDLGSGTVSSTATGAVGGGVLGGVIGAAASLLIPGLGPALAGGILAATLGGAAIGAVAGGFVGSLVNAGVPEDEAQYYHDQLTRGSSIVTVTAPGRYEEAAAILRESGAYNATVSKDMPATNADTVGSASEESLIPAAILPGAAMGLGTPVTAGIVNPLQPPLYNAVNPPVENLNDEQVDDRPSETYRTGIDTKPNQLTDVTTSTATVERYEDDQFQTDTTTPENTLRPRPELADTQTTTPVSDAEPIPAEKQDNSHRAPLMRDSESDPTLPNDSQVW